MLHSYFTVLARTGFTGIQALLLILLVAFLAFGCQPKIGPGGLGGDKYEQDYEEVVHEPYIPRDDGIPLTPAEFKAFNSRGQIDATLSQADAEIVELHFKFFVHEHRRTFERFLERTARFLPHIRKVFNDRGIPEEIAYLAMVESGGNPNAISPAGAAGLWQFMPYTGKKFGLRQTTWLDERRDPFKATYAAADYLLKLYNDFSDWHLAMAAYNAGEGKIGRALDGTGAKDFFELCRLDYSLEEKRRLKDETRQYVPRLLAIVKIMRNLKLLGFQEPSPSDAWALESIEVPPGTNLSGLARNIGLTWDEFSSMNPAFRRTASPPSVTTTAYVLPDKKDSATQWLASSESRMYAAWREYTVRKNDSLNSISKRNGITVAALRQANNFTKLPRPGSVILIPGKGQSVEPVYAALPGGRTAPEASVGRHTVQSGETLFSLAQAWGTDVDSIRKANRMGPKETNLSVGQRISIPGNSKNAPAPKQASSTKQASSSKQAPVRSGADTTYVVRKGDSLYSIARANGMTVQELCKANGLKPDNPKLKAGQSLRVPGSGKAAASAASAPATDNSATKLGSKKPQAAKGQAVSKTIVVAKGDTLFSLAKKYNTSVDALRQANGLKGTSLRLGQKLVVP